MRKVDYSVLMSVYKKENPEYLKKSIVSILEQSKKTNEFIIVQDGKLTQELEEIFDEFKNESCIKIVSLTKNVGLGKALNIGMKHCTNEIIARMDSDDISVKNRCEKQLLKLLENPQIDLIGSDTIEFEDVEKSLEYYKELPHTSDEIFKYCKYRNPFCHPSMMFRKTAVLSVGGYQDCHYFEDYYLWVRMLSNGSQGLNIDEPLVYMRVDNGFYTRRSGISYVKDIFNFRKRVYYLGFNNKAELVFSSIVQMTSALLPGRIRAFLYKHILRK